MGLFDFFKNLFKDPVVVKETPATVTKDIPLEEKKEEPVTVKEEPEIIVQEVKEEPKKEEPAVVKEEPKVETVTVEEKQVVKEEVKKVEEPVQKVEPVKEPIKQKDVMKLYKEDYVKAAELLGVEYAAVRAVAEVESAGKPFLEEGKPQILFEGHIFWKQLKNNGFNPQEELKKNPDLKTVLYSKWTKQYYKSGLKEYDRLKLAMTVDETSALASASWGSFQIMGFNYASCGYKDVKSFVIAMRNSAYNHLEAFCQFIKTNKLDKYLKNHDWAGFAKRYNGAGYAENKYDVKLEKAYNKYA